MVYSVDRSITHSNPKSFALARSKSCSFVFVFSEVSCFLQLASVNLKLLAEQALGCKGELAMASKSEFADMLLEDSGPEMPSHGTSSFWLIARSYMMPAKP